MEGKGEKENFSKSNIIVAKSRKKKTKKKEKHNSFRTLRSSVVKTHLLNNFKRSVYWYCCMSCIDCYTIATGSFQNVVRNQYYNILVGDIDRYLG